MKNLYTLASLTRLEAAPKDKQEVALSTEPSKQQIAFARIHRLPNGTVMGAVVWIPGSVLKKYVRPGQEMIEISFEDDLIRIGKEEVLTVELPQREG